MEVQNNLQNIQQRVENVIAGTSKEVAKKGKIEAVQPKAVENDNVRISLSVFEAKERSVADLMQSFNGDLKDIQKLKKNTVGQMEILSGIEGKLKEMKEKPPTQRLESAGEDIVDLRKMVDEFNSTAAQILNNDGEKVTQNVSKEGLETINGFKLGNDRSSFIGADLTALIDNLNLDIDHIDNGILNSQRGMKELGDFLNGLGDIEASIVQNAALALESVKNDRVKEVDFSKEAENFTPDTIASFDGSVAFAQANGNQNSSVSLLT